MRVFTAWLNNEDPHEQTYLAGFQPSTWHLIIIGDEGIPVMESRNYDDDEYKTVNLTYARPATAWELGALLDLVSIDHLPEAGAQ